MEASDETEINEPMYFSFQGKRYKYEFVEWCNSPISTSKYASFRDTCFYNYLVWMSHRRWIWSKCLDNHDKCTKIEIIETHYILSDILIAMNVHKLMIIFCHLSKDNLSIVDLNQILSIFEAEYELRK